MASGQSGRATGGARILLFGLAGVSFVGGAISLGALVLVPIMFLFDDTGVPFDQLGRQAAVMVAPIPGFGLALAASIMGIEKYTPSRLLAAAVVTAAVLELLAAAPISRAGFMLALALAGLR